MTRITENGFERTRLEERLRQLQDAMRKIFGPGIDLEPDSLDGQTLGIFAHCINQLDQLAETTFQSFHPQTARGIALSRLVALSGIQRKSGTHSTVTLTLGGVNGTRIPKGSLVLKRGSENMFTTLEDAIIGPTGRTDVPAQSIEKGPISAPKGSLTSIVTPIYGWQTVTNTNSAQEGTSEETDEELRARHRKSASLGCASGTIDALYSALLNLPTVRRVCVREDIAQHAVHIIVDAQSNHDAIAQTIWRKKNAGLRLLGKQLYWIEDSQGTSQPIRFSQVRPMDVRVQVRLRRYPGFPPDGTSVLARAIADWGTKNQGIGEPVITSGLYVPLNELRSHSVLSVKIGFLETELSHKDLAVPEDVIARFLPENIHITVEG